MGAAESTNTSDSITEIANTVQQSTKANSNQINNVNSTVNLSDCTIKLDGNFNVESVADLMVSNSQIAQANQDANLQNNVEQTALQQAKSTVGALGVGFATASNAAHQLARSTNTIINDMMTSANQFSSTTQSFNCDRSYIEAKNLNISFKSKGDFLSSQTQRQQQTAKIVNDIKQKVDQKAVATVEGLQGLLFLILLIILAIGYVLFKPLDTAAGKILMISIIIIVIIGVLIWMYANEKPPLFGKPDECIAASNSGTGGKGCKNTRRGSITIQNAPFRYSYPIMSSNGSPNLVQMVIAKVAGIGGSKGKNNGGYTIGTMNALQQKINNNYIEYEKANLGIVVADKIPNPLVNPNPNPSNMYLIPTYYQIDGDGKCTPKIIQVDTNGETNVDTCPSTIKPSTLTPVTIQGTNPDLGIANLNLQEWNEYLGTGSSQLSTDEYKRRVDFARFCLCDILEIELNIYIDGDEIVRVKTDDGTNSISIASTVKDSPNVAKYTPTNQSVDRSEKIESPGVIDAQVGTVDNNTNKYKTVALYVIVPIATIMVIFLGYMIFRGKKKQG